jgi:predicted AlkP superfamily phosphohydrolase/phosphomutase
MSLANSPRRVLVIGLDGATWDLMTPWIEAGKLPNLAKLQQKGAAGPLASTIHPVTTPAWISFMTGRTQGQHGVYDHVRRRPGSYDIEIVDATKIQSPLIFDYLGAHGMKSVAINIPMTYPPRPIAGALVSGLFASAVGPNITSPPTLYDRIATVAPDYVVHPDFQPRAADPLGQYRDDLLGSITSRFTVAETLLAEHEWHLGAVVFTATDQVQHAFWHCMGDEASAYESAVFDVYQRIDENLPRLLRFADENTLVLILSDHGGGPLQAMVNLNRWLADEGWLAFRQSGGVKQRSRLINQAAHAYKTYLPHSVRAWIRRTLPGPFKQAKEQMESALFGDAIAWEETRVYSLGACGSIFVNLRGREPAGLVAPGNEYEALCQEVSERLMTLKTPGGKPLVKQVLRREELYHGPFLADAPDLIIVWHDYGYWGRARYDQSAPELFETDFHWDFGVLPISGTHRPEGILMATGPGVAAGHSITGAKLIDLTPTMMAFLGIPVPRGLDGCVLESIFGPGSLSITYDETDAVLEQGDFAFSAEEEAKIKQHLTDLGYL